MNFFTKIYIFSYFLICISSMIAILFFGGCRWILWLVLDPFKCKLWVLPKFNILFFYKVTNAIGLFITALAHSVCFTISILLEDNFFMWWTFLTNRPYTPLTNVFPLIKLKILFTSITFILSTKLIKLKFFHHYLYNKIKIKNKYIKI